ncbi:MAG: hypothetical protein Q8886_02585 [Candidatus Phytoplasma australasiaticum]|nr:hypothetical protein [Candidatus Phytoplasma australasiaticum]
MEARRSGRCAPTLVHAAIPVRLLCGRGGEGGPFKVCCLINSLNLITTS